MARTDYGAILSTKIADTSQAIRDVNKTVGLIAPTDWGTLIRTMHSSADYDNVMAQLVEETATGDIASFSDGANDIPLKNILLTVTPSQSGSGDPSPSNVRPITGFSRAVITRTGANLCNAQNPIVLSQAGNIGDQPCYLKSGTYTYSWTSSNSTAISLSVWDGNTQVGSFSSTGSVQGRGSLTFTITSNATKIRCYYNGATTVSDIQVEVGTTATAYEPYTATTRTAEFGQTLYGATINLLTGEGNITKFYIKGGFVQYNASNGYKAYRRGDLPVSISTNVGGISNMVSEFGSFSSDNMNKNIIQLPNAGTCYMALLEDYDANDVQICYELATPIPITFTPIENINTLLGENNIFADSGNVEVVYRANGSLYVAQH